MPAPRKVYVFLIIGLVAASQSANIIRLGEAHPIAIAAWRLLLATGLLIPLAGRRLTLLAQLSKREWALLILAGASLAAHFFAWILAVQLTTVANAAIFFSINPVITATGAFLVFGERASRKLVISIILGIIGVGIISSSDLNFHPHNLPGDAAAVGCSILFTVYFLLGKKLRQSLPTSVYVAALYGIAALFCFGAALVIDLPLIDYSGQTWLCFVLMALVPTLIGHTSLNNALRYLDAGRISAATLSEPMLASVVAYYAWGEQITLGAGLGYVLICSSVLVLVFDQLKTDPA